jgi:hypothetical protein
MDTMVEIESRIRIAEQGGRQDVALLKIARNALTPIGRLPSELLVYLVQKLLELTDIGGVPQALLSVTSVCSRIRVCRKTAIWLVKPCKALCARHFAVYLT